MRAVKAAATLFLLSTIVLRSTVFADELQVTDYLGLTRAQKEIDGKVSVTITVRRNEKEELDVGFGNPLLVQRTGVSPNIEGVEVAPMTYEFRGVSAGVWRIRLRNKGLLLDKVEILGDVR